MKNIQTNRKCSAFTLIELLVVIAIIAILAAILFPVFAQARAKARQAACLSNMKQLGLGMMGYYQDYDEVGPITRDYNNTSLAGQSWQMAIMPYVQKLQSDNFSVQGEGNHSIYNCPDNPFSKCPEFQSRACSGYATTVAEPIPVNPLRNRFTYRCGPNTVPCPNPNGPGTVHQFAGYSQPLAAIPAPAELIMIAEHPGEWNQLGSGNGSYVNSPVRSPGSGSYTQLDQWEQVAGKPTRGPIHNNGWNYTFADGHVKWQRPESTIGAAFGGTMGDPYGYWTLDPND